MLADIAVWSNDISQIPAEKILSTEEVRWTTIPMAESLIDNIRNEKDISDEKLNYMNKVDEYIQQIRVFYEKAS